MGMKYDFLYDEILREGIDVDKEKLLDNVDLIKSVFGTNVKNYIKNKLSDHLSNTCNYPISPKSNNSIFLEIKYLNNNLVLYDYILEPIGDIYLTDNEVEATFAYDENPNMVYLDLFNKGIQSKNIQNRIYVTDTKSVNDVYSRLYGNNPNNLPLRYDLYKDRSNYIHRIVCMRPLSFKYKANNKNKKSQESFKDIKGIYTIVLNNIPGWNIEDSQGNITPNVCYVGSQSKGIDARIENFLSINKSDLKSIGSSSYKFMNVYLNRFLENSSTDTYATVYALPQDVPIARSSEVRLINNYFDDPNYMNSPFKLNVVKAR